MKTKKTIGLVLAVCLISALVMAEASTGKQAGEKRKGADVSASKQRDGGVPSRVSPSRRGTSVNRQQMYQEMLAKRLDSHKQALAELEGIKKIAAEENAPRTVEAIGKMIDKKDAEFKQKMKQFEHQRRGRSKQIQQRTAENSTRKKPAETTERKVIDEK